MSDRLAEEQTRAALDEALRAHAAHDLFNDGEVVVSWVALAAVRRHDGGGSVIHMPSNEVMPYWEARGILHEALAAIDRYQANDGDHDG